MIGLQAMDPIIADTNIAVSSILNSKGNIGELLFNNRGLLSLYGPDFLQEEIDKHRPGILKISQLTEEKVDKLIYLVFTEITFISDLQINFNIWREAAPLVRDIDLDDISFVALTLYPDAVLTPVRKHSELLEINLIKKG